MHTKQTLSWEFGYYYSLPEDERAAIVADPTGLSVLQKMCNENRLEDLVGATAISYEELLKLPKPSSTSPKYVVMRNLRTVVYNLLGRNSSPEAILEFIKRGGSFHIEEHEISTPTEFVAAIQRKLKIIKEFEPNSNYHD